MRLPILITEIPNCCNDAWGYSNSPVALALSSLKTEKLHSRMYLFIIPIKITLQHQKHLFINVTYIHQSTHPWGLALTMTLRISNLFDSAVNLLGWLTRDATAISHCTINWHCMNMLITTGMISKVTISHRVCSHQPFCHCNFAKILFVTCIHMALQFLCNSLHSFSGKITVSIR